MKTNSITLIILMLIALVYSCKKDSTDFQSPDNSYGTTTSSSITIKTSINGFVVDENNNPISGATVNAYGKFTTTDKNGMFVFNEVISPESRCYITVTKNGYWKGSKTIIPDKQQTKFIRLMLQTKSINQYFIDASSGGTINLASGSFIDFPADAFMNEDGSLYSGTVFIAATHLDPTDANFGLLVPGDMQAKRMDGSTATLWSFGVLGVELYSTGGHPLKLAGGKQATLNVKVASLQLSSAPSTLPLWHFDEIAGIWKEEGSAALQGDIYVGNVNHFSFWNCDRPYPSCTVKGKVVDCNGKPVAGVTITSPSGGSVQTDGNGEYSEFAPATIGFKLEVNNSSLGITGSINVGPFVAGSTNLLPDLVVTCAAALSGKLVDCNNADASGYMVVDHSGTISIYPTNGTFSIPVMANTAVTISAFLNSGNTFAAANYNTPAKGITANIGNLQACAGIDLSNSFILNGGIYHNQLFIFHPHENNQAYISYWGTHIYIGDIAEQGSIYMCWPGTTTGTYTTPSDKNTFSLRIFNPELKSDSVFSSFVVNITKYGSVGENIEGDFSGTFTGLQGTTSYTVSSGKFSIKRKW